MALNFPNTPFRGAVYEAEGQRWYWNDEAWVTPFVRPLIQFLGVTYYGATTQGNIVYPTNVLTGDLLIHAHIARDNVGPQAQEIGTNFTKIAFCSTLDNALSTSALLAFEVAAAPRSGALGGFTNNNNGYTSMIFHYRFGLPILTATPRNAVVDFSDPAATNAPIGPLVIDTTPPVADIDIACGVIGIFTGDVATTVTLSEAPSEEYNSTTTHYAWVKRIPTGDITFTDGSTLNRKAMAGGVLNLTLGAAP